MSGPVAAVIGWDIGGVNTKAARVAAGESAVRARPYELQRDPAALPALLAEMAREVGGRPGDAHAVTMTAELSQFFRTKREGVAFVLDAVDAAFPGADVRVYTVDGRFLGTAAARREPLAVAASNWAAAARLVARRHPDALLIDVGTTTTDVIPIVGGAPAAHGRTDPERLACGELVYLGALRTPVEAITSTVPLGGESAGVSAEGFALAGDVHLWRGTLTPEHYTVPTPDGRPATREFARERLARVVCGDRELLDDDAITRLADHVAATQVGRIAGAVSSVRSRHRAIETAVVTGLGAFLAADAARLAGLRVVHLAGALGDAGAHSAPATAVAMLLAAELAIDSGGSRHEARGTSEPGGLTPSLAALPQSRGSGGATNRIGARSPSCLVPPASSPLDAVVKLGGGVLRGPTILAQVGAVLGRAGRDGRRIVVLPGGGPFANAVRDVDRRVRLDDDAAHWMAILGMEQYAHLLASRIAGAALVESADGVRAALAAGRVPVLAPFRWLRAADPLPHSWDVSSDSIAAWLAGALGARRLVLVKPEGAGESDGVGLVDPCVVPFVDPYFSRVRPAGVGCAIVAAADVARLEALLRADEHVGERHVRD